MKGNFILCLILLLSAHAFAQIQLKYSEAAPTSEEAAKVSEFVAKYSLLTLDQRALNKFVKENKSGAKVDLILGQDLSWEITLEENEIRFGGFKASLVSGETEQSLAVGECNTYRGYVNGDMDQYVRFFISDDFVKGVIVDKEKGTFMIEPLSAFTRSESDDRLVLYKLADFKDGGRVCGVSDEKQVMKSARVGAIESSSYTSCRIMELITEADGEYYINHGSNATTAANDMLASVNIASGAYNSTFNLRLVVVKQIIHQNPATDPFISNDGLNSGMINEYKNHWNLNFPYEKRDAAILFSGKVPTNGVLGESFSIGPVCRDLQKSYSFIADFPNISSILVHEVGHLLNAQHTFGSDCPTIMCKWSTAPANVIFANVTQNEINSHLNAGDACLHFFDSVGMTGPNDLCVNSSGNYQVSGGPLNSSSNWTWTSSSNVSLNTSTGNTVTATGTADGLGWVEASKDIGCPLTERFYMMVGKPVVNILVNGSDIYDDFCTSENVSIEVTSIFVPIDVGSWSYNWSIAYGNTSGNLNASNQFAYYYNDHPECTGIDIGITNVCGTITERVVICTESCYPWFKVYPNPAEDRVSVEFESIDKVDALPDRLVLYSEKSLVPIETILVAEAYSQNRFEGKVLHFDVRELPRGIYYLHVVYDKQDSRVKTEKIRILLE